MTHVPSMPVVSKMRKLRGSNQKNAWLLRGGSVNYTVRGKTERRQYR